MQTRSDTFSNHPSRLRLEANQSWDRSAGRQFKCRTSPVHFIFIHFGNCPPVACTNFPSLVLFAFFKLRILFLHRPLRCPNDNCKYVAISRFGSKGQWLLFLLLVCLSFSTFSQLFHFIFSFCPFPPTGHAPGDLQNVLQLPCPLILIPLFKTLFASSAMKIDHSWQKFLLPSLQFLFPLPLATPPAPVV